jgi:ABC-type uncharacterized transport system auxiliary subunit
MKIKISALSVLLLLVLIVGCGRPLHRNFYVLNYTPDRFDDRRRTDSPYPVTIRLRTFDIEKAYARPNIVYRENPFRLDFYPDHLWAVRPVDMITDLIFGHLEGIRLVESVTRRLDERSPDFELSGTVLAIEEFNSGDSWFAHLRISFVLTDFRTGNAIYSRIFSQTRAVPAKTPLSVVMTLSEVMSFIASLLMIDLDNVLYERLSQRESN